MTEQLTLLPTKRKRARRSVTLWEGACRVCEGRLTRRWRGRTAAAVAARHHDATGHTCWIVSTTRIELDHFTPAEDES